MAGVAVVRHTIGDKIIGVCTRSIVFLTNLCRSSDPSMNGQQLKEVHSHTQTMLTNLVEKLGDNLAKVRQAAESAILAMCSHSSFGVSQCITAIIKTGKKSSGPENAKKAMNSNKLIISRYQTLARILGEIANIPED